MLIPVRWHGYINFPCTDINSCCVRFQYRTTLQAHPFSLAPFAFAHRGVFLAGLFRMLLLPGHGSLPFSSGRAKSRKSRYSFEGNQPGVLPQAVTNVWRTELGTKLLNGLNSTTDISAYFRYLCLLQFATNRRLAPSSSPVWPRLPGSVLSTERSPVGLWALSVILSSFRLPWPQFPVHGQRKAGSVGTASAA